MFRGDLLIDGYNVLHAAGLAKHSYGPGEFERTRRRFLKLLAGQLSPRERHRTTVVFDAPPQSLGASPPREIYELLVVFAGDDGDADAAIERLIRQNSAPRRLHVISSDRRIQKAARRRRARSLSAADFLARIVARKTPQERAEAAEPAAKREGLQSPGEVQAWLELFSAERSLDLSAPAETPPAPAEGQSPKRKAPRTNLPGPAHTDELRFWEARIASLWENTSEETEE